MARGASKSSVQEESPVGEARRWLWSAAKLSVDGLMVPGYVMHSSAVPKSPEALCRWAIYRHSAFRAIIALNGRIFGYEDSGIMLKAQARIERVAASMGHVPVALPVSKGGKS